MFLITSFCHLNKLLLRTKHTAGKTHALTSEVMRLGSKALALQST